MNMSLLREKNFVNGAWCEAQSGKRMDVYNPANGERLGSVPAGSKEDAEAAVAAAQAALPAWAALTAKERSAYLRAWYEEIMVNQKDLAELLTTEMGKILEEARGEIAYGASYVAWFAEEAKRIYGEVLPAPHTQQRSVALRRPVGVVGAITPWNFPSAMILRKCAPALAAGCPVVLKPSSATPYSALALALLAEKVGFPAGVLNVITGDSAAIGAVLTDDPRVRKISFTGSTQVGKKLAQACGAHMKRYSMELGGNAPFIVFADADLDAAAQGLIQSKFRNSGQTCVCTNRAYVERSVYEAFLQKVEVKVRALKVGDGMDPANDQGALINPAALEKVQRHIDDALSKGARVVCGGAALAGKGNFFAPTLLRDCTPDMLFAHEETFGPLLGLIPFDSDEEALRAANDAEVGLAGYFYTHNMARAWRFAEALEVGMVGVNTGSLSSELTPFGGIKGSGVGREGSKFGIQEFLDIHYVCFDLGKQEL